MGKSVIVTYKTKCLLNIKLITERRFALIKIKWVFQSLSYDICTWYRIQHMDID